MVNAAVCFFMMEDLQMYDPATDERCRVRSMALADELGQVSHIFSDKTGVS
jgi:magnesium-transporting ATPase (P-type)